MGQDDGRSLSGRATPAEPVVSALREGIANARPLRELTHEELINECCYRGAEIVIERTRSDLSNRRFFRALEDAWTDFLDANPDDLTSPEELPDHALITLEQVKNIVAQAIESQGGEAR